ncbi:MULTISPECIES: LuxR C-terminal-related transcriptional regulator [Chryseobacterium]|nr:MULTISPECIES: LuxR C-terminal-related transcriptional regulator [Chryseobacterium]
MNYLSYISLTTAMSFFFNYRKDKIAIITLIVSFIVFFLINYYTNYSLLPNLHQNLSFTEQHYIRFYKTLEVVFCTLVAVYFIHRKEKIIIRYIVETEGLNKRLKENKQILSRDLYDMAVNNNPLFISSFSSSFPNFFNSILKINPQIIAPELEICALIKLGLRTKEIAQVTKSTVRSVENKKYRIRKKLNIPSDVDTNLFIINTFNIDD